MIWNSLLKNPHDLPQRINKYEESADVMVIERYLNDDCNGFEYGVYPSACYYGHWKPNGEEGWRVRGTDYCDCGKFGGFPTDESYRKGAQIGFGIDAQLLNDCEYSKEQQEFIKNNCEYDKEYDCYITRWIVGWAYYPNEADFVWENKDILGITPKCQELTNNDEDEDDAYKLAEDYFFDNINNDKTYGDVVAAFMAGYKKAKEK